MGERVRTGEDEDLECAALPGPTLTPSRSLSGNIMLGTRTCSEIKARGVTNHFDNKSRRKPYDES